MRKEKRIKTGWLLLTAVLLTGCAAETGQTTEATTEAAAEITTETAAEAAAQTEEAAFSPEDVAALGLQEELLAYWLVLNSKKPFVSTNEGSQEFYWDEYFWDMGRPYWNQGSWVGRMSHFLLVDMDGDGSFELVLDGFVGTTQLFHYEDGVVYSWQLSYRGMKNIKINGVYNGSSSAGIGGWYRITEFHGDSYTKETLAYLNTNYIDEEKSYYEVEGREVSSDEFYAYAEQLRDLEEAETFDFTEDLLEEKLLGGLNEEELSIVRNIPVEAMQEEELPYAEEELAAYTGVLTGRKALISADDGTELFIRGNYLEDREGHSVYQAAYFSIADMDGDGLPEVILTCFSAEDAAYGETFILHSVGTDVIGYQCPEYKFVTIFKAGSFCCSALRGLYGQILSFGESGCEWEIVDEADLSDTDPVRYYTFSNKTLKEVFAIALVKETR